MSFDRAIESHCNTHKLSITRGQSDLHRQTESVHLLHKNRPTDHYILLAIQLYCSYTNKNETDEANGKDRRSYRLYTVSIHLYPVGTVSTVAYSFHIQIHI